MWTLIYVSTCRQDYLYAHKGVVPSLEGAASQLNILKKERGLRTVFLASDAPLDGEYRHWVCAHLYQLPLPLRRQEGAREDGEGSGLVHTYRCRAT